MYLHTHTMLRTNLAVTAMLAGVTIIYNTNKYISVFECQHLHGSVPVCRLFIKSNVATNVASVLIKVNQKRSRSLTHKLIVFTY